MITEGITHNLLICDPISHPFLYQIPRENPDPDIFQIALAGFMGVIEFVFAQYGVSMRVSLNLDVTGTSAIDPFAVDLPFTRCLLYVIGFPASSVARAAECLAC